MNENAYGAATIRIINRANQVFFEHGYSAVTMSMVGELCGLGRRALYYHFHSKEELFRATIRTENGHLQALADAAAEAALQRGGGAEEVIGGWLDTRYGEFRRRLHVSPHGAELNQVAFRVATDIMIDVAIEANRKLEQLIAGLISQGRLRLRPGVSTTTAARMIADGARGVNQARPPIPENELASRYFAIAEAILFGCALPPRVDRRKARKPE